MRVEWADDEPEFIDRPGNSGRKFYAFAAELRQHPGQWAKYPGTYTRHRDTARSIANSINGGRRPTLPATLFEARVDISHVVWVRALR